MQRERGGVYAVYSGRCATSNGVRGCKCGTRLSAYADCTHASRRRRARRNTAGAAAAPGGAGIGMGGGHAALWLRCSAAATR